MSLPDTAACSLSNGRKIIGRDPYAQKFISRVNSVDKALCDIVRRTKIQASRLYGYCPQDQLSSSSWSSSSSSACRLSCAPVAHTFVYQINVNDLDDDAYQLIELLEAEVCASLRAITDLEKNNIICNSSSSSSSSSTSFSSSSYSSSSSSSYSSSSESSSLSPSSSSSSPVDPVGPELVYLASYCGAFPFTVAMPRTVHPGIGYGDYAYASEAELLSSSSSSSSTSSSSSGAPSSSLPPSSSESSSLSSSSSGQPGHLVELKFNTSLNRWELSYNGLIATKLGTETAPQGAYMFAFGPCAGESIFVI